MKALDLIVWVWVMPAMPEIGINTPRPQRHLCQVLEVGRYSSKIRLVDGGKSITIKNKMLQQPTQLDTVQMALQARRAGRSRVATRLERVASRTARGVL